MSDIRLGMQRHCGLEYRLRLGFRVQGSFVQSHCWPPRSSSAEIPPWGVGGLGSAEGLAFGEFPSPWLTWKLLKVPI